MKPPVTLSAVLLDPLFAEMHTGLGGRRESRTEYTQEVDDHSPAFVQGKPGTF